MFHFFTDNNFTLGRCLVFFKNSLNKTKRTCVYFCVSLSARYLWSDAIASCRLSLGPEDIIIATLSLPGTGIVFEFVLNIFAWKLMDHTILIEQIVYLTVNKREL